MGEQKREREWEWEGKACGRRQRDENNKILGFKESKALNILVGLGQ